MLTLNTDANDDTLIFSHLMLQGVKSSHPMIHVWTRALVHACTGAPVHACNRALVHACSRALVHACTRDMDVLEL